MELQLELEEAHKAQEEADKKVSQMSQEIKQMIQDMLSNGMSVSQIAKCVSKSEEEILELICQPPLWWLFVSTLSGKRRFENYSVNI